MISVGDRYETNRCGFLTVIKVISSEKVLVKFDGTGSERIARHGNVRAGSVTDLFMPSVFGVGYLGDGEYKSKYNRVDCEMYKCWSHMIERCYSKSFQEKSPWYAGCKVDSNWHNFQNFAKWYVDNHPKDGGRYALDKDIKIKGNRTYSDVACMFVTAKENSVHARAKRYEFLSPDGLVVDVFNLSEFCRRGELSLKCMLKVHSGKQDSHKGWVRCLATGAATVVAGDVYKFEEV